MRQTLGLCDGWLCVVYEENAWAEPVRVTRYWPVAKMSEADIEYRGLELGGEVFDLGMDGLYRQHRGSCKSPIDLRLKDGGSTKPIKTEREEISPPRTRVATRYLMGRWEKCLARSGWVVA